MINIEGDFLRIIDNCDNIIYHKTEKIGTQTAVVSFIENIHKNKICYYVAFVIANKKKDINNWFNEQLNNIDFKQTGKNGIKSLLWAKSEIINFEKWILENDKRNDFNNKNVFICVTWTDNRRRNVYERGLSKIGYETGPIDGCKCLYKQIK